MFFDEKTSNKYVDYNADYIRTKISSRIENS